MGTQVILTLPSDVYERAKRQAEVFGRAVDEILIETVLDAFPPPPLEMDVRPIANMSNAEVLVTADSMMDEALNDRRSALVQKQKALIGLTEAEEAELEMLWNVYNVGQLRKAQAIVEAVKRGLRTAPKP